ncbi:uncharacterized protein LOC110383391 [Helicoverpa armigera]|uniref:uncharacterized protein LOC110383391 n=1 Tax=Helicoverpa armigera TaxID=29058 RepID=UPI0030833C8B
MSAFRQLKEVSNDFEQQLRSVTTQLFSAEIGEAFEDDLSKRLQDLKFFRSKLRLLAAKPLAALPQVTEHQKSEQTVKEYGELAESKVLEQVIVKSLTQSHAVTALLKTPDKNLDPEMVERKQKIIASLKAYRDKETELRYLQMVEAEKRAELDAVRKQWDQELTELRVLREDGNRLEECDVTTPLYKRLRGLVNKLELMRTLLARLVTSRGRRDWLAEPARTARLLALTRTPCSLHSFLHQ